MHRSSYLLLVVVSLVLLLDVIICVEWSSLNATTLRALPASDFGGITASQLASIPSAACAGFTPSQVEKIPASAVPGFSAACIAQTSSTAFTYLSDPQVKALSVSAFRGFTNQLGYVQWTTFNAISLDQLLNLKPMLGNMTAIGLSTVINKYPTLLNRWTEQNCGEYPLSNAFEFKSTIPKSVNYQTTWQSISADLPTATWLQIALMHPVTGMTFPNNFVGKLSYSAVKGIRADQVPQIPSVSFGGLRILQSSNLVRDTMSVISKDQLYQIQDYVFGDIDPEAISGIPVSIIPTINRGQLWALQVDQVQAMSCDQLVAFKTYQVDEMHDKPKKEYINQLRACAMGPVSPPVTPPVAPPTQSPSVSTPVTTPVIQSQPPIIRAPVTTPVMSPENSPSNQIAAPGTGGIASDFSKYYKLLIAGGCGAFIVILIVGIVWFVKRMRDPERRGLLANPNEQRYEYVA